MEKYVTDDFLVEVLRCPELESSEEFKEWIKDDANREMYLNAMAVREAYTCSAHKLNIDVDKSLKSLQKRLMWRKVRRRAVTTLAGAACIVLVALPVSLFWRESSWNLFGSRANEGLAVYVASDSVREVTLTSGGKMIGLESDTVEFALRDAGASVSDGFLSYVAGEADGDVTNVLAVPAGKTYRVALPDGTEVWLNSETRLDYPSAFCGDERRVVLRGEAYFKVAKDEVHPFVVQAGNLETKVLGTEFNVRCYDADDRNVTLVQGGVVVNSGMGRAVRLLPGQNALIRKDGRIGVENVDVREYVEWKSGFLYFDDRDLASIFRTVGRWYNVSVRCEDREIMRCHYNLWVDINKSLDENLDVINEIGGLKSELVDGVVVVKK